MTCCQTICVIEGERTDNPERYLDRSGAKSIRTIELVRHDLNITSLNYLEIEDMIAAVGLPEDQIDLHCRLVIKNHYFCETSPGLPVYPANYPLPEKERRVIKFVKIY